jgi:hypothetical protein
MSTEDGGAEIIADAPLSSGMAVDVVDENASDLKEDSMKMETIEITAVADPLPEKTSSLRFALF